MAVASMKNSFLLLLLVNASTLVSAPSARSSASFLSEIPTPDAPVGRIRGRLRTQDVQPAAFVSVVLKGATKGALSGEDGAFFIKNVKAGSYPVETRFLGLKPQEQTVTVLAGQTVVLDFTLSENAAELAEVVVSGNISANSTPLDLVKIAIRPMNLPQSVAGIDRSVLDRQQVLWLSDAIRNVTGVYLMGTPGGTI